VAQLQSQLNTTAHKTINNKTLTNMIHNGIEYYTFDELFPIAQAALRNKILNSEYKFLGDINKTFNNKTDTGK
jgi:ethanolamine utilization cobalamin adenosyltransferase